MLFGLPFLSPKEAGYYFVLNCIPIKRIIIELLSFQIILWKLSKDALFPLFVWTEYSTSVSRTTSRSTRSLVMTFILNIQIFFSYLEIYTKKGVSSRPKTKAMLDKETCLYEKIILLMSNIIERHHFVSDKSLCFNQCIFETRKCSSIVVTKFQNIKKIFFNKPVKLLVWRKR